MRRSRLLVAALVVLVAPAALAQEVISPYGDEAPAAGPSLPPGAPAPVAPTPGVAPVAPLPPVPPPVVVPPPYYQQQPPCPMGYAAQPLYAGPRFHEVSEPRYGLAIAGAVILGASWSINAFSAYVADEWKLAVPVVGPFLETQNIDTSAGHDYNRPVVALLVFDGLVETAGAIMIFAGALTHHTVRKYDRAPSIAVVPTAGPSAAGVAAFGHF